MSITLFPYLGIGLDVWTLATCDCYIRVVTVRSLAMTAGKGWASASMGRPKMVAGISRPSGGCFRNHTSCLRR